MAKKKNIPQYQLSLGATAKSSPTQLQNIYNNIKRSREQLMSRVDEVASAKPNEGITIYDVARRFVSKMANDTVDGELTFSKGIKSDNYIEGALGNGFKLYKDIFGKGILNIDQINVKDSIHTPLLTYDKLNYAGGSIVLSAAWAELTAVVITDVGADKVAECYYKPESTNEQLWKAGDQIRIKDSLSKSLYSVVLDANTTIINNPSAPVGMGDGVYWFIVYLTGNGSTDDNSNVLQIGDSTPEVGDIVVQWGHRAIEKASLGVSVTEDKTRQNIIIMSTGGSDKPYIEQYTGVNSFDLSNNMMTRISDDVFFGDPSNAKKSYLWWNRPKIDGTGGNQMLLLKGVINQSPADDGDTGSPVIRWRGAWNIATDYYTGDGVYYDGSSYMALTDILSYGNPPAINADWEIYARKGIDGDSGIVLNLTNDSHTVPTNEDGSGGNYTGCGGTVEIFVGGVNDIANWSVSAVPSSGVTGGYENSGKTYAVTAMTGDTGRLDFTATKGPITIHATFSVSKNKKGVNGENSVIYKLVLKNSAINKDPVSNIFTPSSITIAAQRIDGNSTPEAYPAHFVVIESNGITPSEIYASTAKESAKTLTLGGLVDIETTFLTIKLYQDNTLDDLLDEEIIPITFNGIDGTNGDNGYDGITVRYTAWKEGVAYFDGVYSGANTSRYLDYVTKRIDDTVQAFKCKIGQSHTSDYAKRPTDGGNTYWETITYMPVIASDLVLANQAVIGGFRFSPAIDEFGNAVDAVDQFMETIDGSIKLNGDGSGQLAKGELSWDETGKLSFGKKLDSQTLEISTQTIPTLSTIKSKDTTSYADVDTSVYKDIENPAYVDMSSNYSQSFTVIKATAITIEAVYQYYWGYSVPSFGTDGSIFLQELVAGDWITIETATEYSFNEAAEHQYYKTFELILNGYELAAGTYRILVAITAGHGAYVGGAYKYIHIYKNISNFFRRPLMRKLSIGTDGISLFDTAMDEYFRLSLQDREYQLRIKMKTDIGGVLAAGSVSSTGIVSNTWGAFTDPLDRDAAFTAPSFYQVYHKALPDGYAVIVSSTQDERYPIVVTKEAEYFNVRVRNGANTEAAGSFDYTIIGNN